MLIIYAEDLTTEEKKGGGASKPNLQSASLC